MKEIIEPRLAPPGAGLPRVELLIARLLMSWRRRIGSRESFIADFRRERDLIKQMYSVSDQEVASKPILIRRLPGLEDSSRYWSVWMTLDHLRIVNQGMAGVISSLAGGNIPPREANTAAVKPSQSVTCSVLPEYEGACDSLLSAATTATELKTAACFNHPWFGPLNAFGWLALAGTHMALHRKQIQRILQAIRSQV